jgi:hypothetical protein
MSQIEGMAGNEDKKKQLVYEALKIAEKGLEIDPTIPYVHKW